MDEGAIEGNPGGPKQMVKKNLLEQAARALYYVAENGDPQTFYLERYEELAEQLLKSLRMPEASPDD